MLVSDLDKRISRFKWYVVYDNATERFVVHQGSVLMDYSNKYRFKPLVHSNGPILSANSQELAAEQLAKIMSTITDSPKKVIQHLKSVDMLIDNLKIKS